MARKISQTFGGGFDVVHRYTSALNDERTKLVISYICQVMGFNLVSKGASRHGFELAHQVIRRKRLLLETSDLEKLLWTQKRPIPWVVSGYFQNYGFLQEQVGEIASLLREYFQNGAKESEALPSEFIGLHVRLGDYRNLTSLYGGFSTSYYQAALDLIHDEEDGRKLPSILISDDTQGALELLGTFMNKVDLKPAPPTASPINHLNLLSHAQYIIAPSSTFSWWASRIGRTKQIFLPRPFLLDPIKNGRVDLRSPNTKFLSR